MQVWYASPWPFPVLQNNDKKLTRPHLQPTQLFLSLLYLLFQREDDQRNDMSRLHIIIMEKEKSEAGF